jgi:alanine racemase
VDLAALCSNVESLRRRLPAATRFIAVIKADGYGHGARPVARAALSAGAWGLAVVTLEEAAEVRDLLSVERILVLGPLLAEDAREAVQGGYALGCSSLALARALDAAAGARRVPIHLKLDTGMGRYGARLGDFAEIARFIASARGLELAGTWSHLATSDSDSDFAQEQYQRFRDATEGMPGIRHLANSGAVRWHPEMALDGVRVGIGMYGCEDPELAPVLQLRARVAQVKVVATGGSVGYGRTWTASEPTRIATVSIGYADGVFRARSNRGDVIVRGHRLPLVGQVSMDSITVDASAVPDIEVGDPATLIGADGGERIRAEEVAAWSGTISYEVLTSIGRRVERIYRGGP